MGGRRWVPTPVSMALVGVMLALVGNLATNLVEVDAWWWRPSVLVALGLLIVGALVLEGLRHRAERMRAQLDPVAEQSRLFGAVPRRSWQWQPRPNEEKQLRAALGRRGRAALVALPGARGAGKSQLAAGYARWCLEQRFDLVAWINAESGPVPELALLAAHLGLPGVAEMPPEQAAAAVCRWLERDVKARRLLVFDNVDDPDMLKGFVPAAGSAKVLITTNRREFTTMAGIAVVDVGMFSPAEGGAFLFRATGLKAAEDAVQLGELLGWLPLGLAQAAAFIQRTKISYAEYIKILQGQRLDETLRQQAGADHPGVLKATRLSLAGVAETDQSGDAARLLRLLSVLSPDGVSRDLLLGAERHLRLIGGVVPAVGVLVDASLAVLGGDASTAGFGDGRRVVAVHRLTARVVRHQAGEAPGADLAETLGAASQWLKMLTDHFPDVQAARRHGELDELAAHLEAVRSCAGDPSPLLLVAADRIGQLLAEVGELNRAVTLLEQTLVDRVRLLGPNHSDTLTTCNNLAGAYESVGQLNEAISLHEQTLSDAVRVLGPDHPDTLAFCNDLAYAYQSAGRLDEAIILYERTLADRERTLGPNAHGTLISRDNLGSAYRSVGRLDEALTLHEQTLNDAVRVLGPDHHDTLTTRGNVAGTYRMLGRWAEAIRLYEQTLVDLERVLGLDHPHTLVSRHNLATVYGMLGRWEAAIPLYQQVLADRQRILGPDHPQTLTSQNSLADALNAVRNRCVNDLHKRDEHLNR